LRKDGTGCMSLTAIVGLKGHLLCSPTTLPIVHISALKWRQYAPPKHRYQPTKLHKVKPQKSLFILKMCQVVCKVWLQRLKTALTIYGCELIKSNHNSKSRLQFNLHYNSSRSVLEAYPGRNTSSYFVQTLRRMTADRDNFFPVSLILPSSPYVVTRD
jgi:hypothetical protein